MAGAGASSPKLGVQCLTLLSAWIWRLLSAGGASAGAKEEFAELEANIAAHCVVAARWRGQRARPGACVTRSEHRRSLFVLAKTFLVSG